MKSKFYLVYYHDSVQESLEEGIKGLTEGVELFGKVMKIIDCVTGTGISDQIEVTTEVTKQGLAKVICKLNGKLNKKSYDIAIVNEEAFEILHKKGLVKKATIQEILKHKINISEGNKKMFELKKHINQYNKYHEKEVKIWS